MCGICGFFGNDIDFNEYEKACHVITEMTNTLAHRGPDGYGIWVDISERVALGHRRLSIIDLSENGKQPMISKSERYVISFNGEIYNYLEMKKELRDKGVEFKSTCDTEVLLEHISEYGIKKTLLKSVGMFGIALYDRDEKKLYLARDRFGEKSVYYGWNSGRFVFGSELKCIKHLPFFDGRVDKDSIYLYMKYGYIVDPWSIYEGIYKLRPGEVVEFDLTTQKIKNEFYYSLEEVICRNEKNVSKFTLDDASSELDNLLEDIIRKQLHADVPVGLFLSSGIDSALTTAIAQRVTDGKLKTYSIGSYDEKTNEAPLAKEYAKILGTDHHEYYLTDEECRDLILKLPSIYDEPFGQPSAIPTFLVSRLARKDVKVVLAGDGGDELFGGYERDVRDPATYEYMLRTEEYSKFDGLYDYLQYRMFKRAGFTDDLLIKEESDNRKYKLLGSKRISNLFNKALYYETMTFMEGETLVKVDRASLANSLEVREPFLNPDIADFAYRLPQEYKYYHSQNKIILKHLLSRYLPRELFDIPKKGFHVPINNYLKSEALKELMEWAFDEETLKKSNLFDIDKVLLLKSRQMDNIDKLPYQNETYCIFILQLWLKENGYI